MSQFFPGMEPLDPAALSACRSEEEAAALLQAALTRALAAKKAALDGVRVRQFARVAQYLALVQHDNQWSDHLRGMNYLKESVVMRKYMGRDVLQEYLSEGAALFEAFLGNARRGTVYSLFAYQAVPPKA